MYNTLKTQQPNLTPDQIAAAIEQNLTASGIDSFMAADVARLTSQGLSPAQIDQVLQYSYNNAELEPFGLQSLQTQSTPTVDYTNLGGLSAPQIAAMVSAGILTPQVLSNLSQKPQTIAPTTYESLQPVKFGTGQQLNFGGMNSAFLKPADWSGWGTHQALPAFDPNAFTKQYMTQPQQAEWSQGANQQTAQYVPQPFVPKTSYEYNPTKIFGPSNQPGGVQAIAPTMTPATPVNTTGVNPNPVFPIVPTT